MTGSTPEDDAAFKKLLQDDPENKKCFECGYPYPQWCSYTHGIMMCLECSGKHRGLGTHLVQVRSSTMDGWSNWKPEKLRQMTNGGNRKCRIFFEENGIADLPIKQKYEHPKSQLYKARLEAIGLGQPFDEANFRAVDYTPRPAQNQDRFKGSGSGGSGGGSRQPAQESEWMSTLSSGWNSVAAGASSAMTSASKSVSQTANNVSTSVNSGELGNKVSATASETAATVSQGATKAWGAVAFFATSLASTVKKSVEGDNKEEDDGLGALTRGIEKTKVSEAEKDRYGHVEHVAERTNSSDDGLRGLTAGLQRGNCKYESFGSDMPAQKTKTSSSDDFLSALDEKPKGKTQTSSVASSPPPAAKQPKPATPVTEKKTSPPQQKKKAEEEDDWNTDW